MANIHALCGRCTKFTWYEGLNGITDTSHDCMSTASALISPAEWEPSKCSNQMEQANHMLECKGRVFVSERSFVRARSADCLELTWTSS